MAKKVGDFEFLKQKIQLHLYPPRLGFCYLTNILTISREGDDRKVVMSIRRVHLAFFAVVTLIEMWKMRKCAVVSLIRTSLKTSHQLVMSIRMGKSGQMHARQS